MLSEPMIENLKSWIKETFFKKEIQFENQLDEIDKKLQKVCLDHHKTFSVDIGYLRQEVGCKEYEIQYIKSNSEDYRNDYDAYRDP